MDIPAPGFSHVDTTRMTRYFSAPSMLTFPRIISPPRSRIPFSHRFYPRLPPFKALSSSRISFSHRIYPRFPPFKAPLSSRIRFPHRFSSSHHRLPPFRAPSSSCIPSHRFPSSVLLTFRAPSSSRIFEILLNKSLPHILKISCTWLRSVIFFFFLLGFE